MLMNGEWYIPRKERETFMICKDKGGQFYKAWGNVE